MARDYKHRAHPKRAQSKQPVAGWKWLLTLLLIAGFCYFLYSLRDEQPGDNTWQTVKNKVEVQKPKSEKVESKDQGPTFDFYTILPEKEVIVGDYPKKTQKQEKNVSKTKTSQYLIQAGAFTNYKDADRLKAKLALMGIESRIEKARVGGVEWNRIKIGPFTDKATVDRLRERLQKSKIKTMVSEVLG